MSQRILIDANCIGSISLFSMSDLRINEMPNAIIYGFLRQLQTIYKGTKSGNFIFMWDSRKSLRKEIFPEYKKRRKELSKCERDTWAIAYEAFAKLKNEYLPRMGFKNQILFEGYEADDTLAKTAKVYKNSIIVTTDGDLLQCLPYADIWNPRKKELVTAERFEREHDIPADRWGEMKAIVGCKSDEVPGINRVGNVTCVRYLLGKLSKYSKVPGKIKSPEGQAIIERNKKLVILPFKNTPLQLLKKNKPNFEEFKKICNELQMYSLIRDASLGLWKKILKGPQYGTKHSSPNHLGLVHSK